MLFMFISCFDETDLQDVEQICGSEFIERYNVEELLNDLDELKTDSNTPDTAIVDTSSVVLEPECQDYKDAFEDLKEQEQRLLLSQQQEELRQDIESESDCELIQFALRPSLSTISWVIDLKAKEGGGTCSLSCADLFELSNGMGLHCQTYTKDTEDAERWTPSADEAIGVSGEEIGRVLFSSVF